MLTYEELVAKLSALQPLPRGRGRVELVVVRPETELRETPARCTLSVETGVFGDRWSRRERPVLDAQVSVMRVDVARIIADGRPLSLFGDNLLVDLDLSPEHLPVGVRLEIGTSVCEVTPKKHTGCVKFATRFGQPARDVTQDERFASMRLRGLFVRVVEPGEVSPGDAIRVV